MANTDRPQEGRGAPAPDQAKNPENRHRKPVPTDDSPRREDELVGGLLQDPSPEDDGKLSGKDEKGVVPGGKKRD